MNILDLLTNEEKAKIKVKEFKPHNVLFNEGDICEYLGILIDGELSINTYTYLDKEETITMIYPEMLFGQFLIFSKKPIYLGTIVAVRKSKVALIKKDLLIKLIQNNTNFCIKYLEITSNESMKNKQQAKLFAHKAIRDRIMYYFESNQKNNIVTIKNVTDLANILSIPRPSLSREITKLENDGIIVKQKNKIILK